MVAVARRPEVEMVQNLRCRHCADIQDRVFYDPAFVEVRCTPNRVPNTGPIICRIECVCDRCGKPTSHYVQAIAGLSTS